MNKTENTLEEIIAIKLQVIPVKRIKITEDEQLKDNSSVKTNNVDDCNNTKYSRVVPGVVIISPLKKFFF